MQVPWTPQPASRPWTVSDCASDPIGPQVVEGRSNVGAAELIKFLPTAPVGGEVQIEAAPAGLVAAGLAGRVRSPQATAPRAPPRTSIAAAGTDRSAVSRPPRPR